MTSSATSTAGSAPTRLRRSAAGTTSRRTTPCFPIVTTAVFGTPGGGSKCSTTTIDARLQVSSTPVQPPSRSGTVSAKAYSEGKTLFGDMPVLFDYDYFAIEPWREPVLRAAESTNRPDRRQAGGRQPCLRRPDLPAPALRDHRVAGSFNLARDVPVATLAERQ